MSSKNGTSKELQKKHNAIAFINAAADMIEEAGIEHISIRKIAEKAGFHNSTIYLYFKDLDELLLLASVRFFQECEHSLSLISNSSSSEESFFKVWDFFLTTVLKRPNLFYNFFYGKRSQDLTSYMERYYELFPEEQEAYASAVGNRYCGKNISERSLNLLLTALPETDRVTKENAPMVNDIIISYCKYKLEQKIADPSLDSEQLKKDCLQVISFVTGI